jgi:glycosyltransferase involved in cell wall biosynthesis
MLVLTNFPRFPEAWRSRSGITGRAIMLKTAWEFLKHSRHADLVIINCDPPLAMKLAALYFLFPFLRRPVLAHDIVLRRPSTWRMRLATPLKRFLLARIDHFSLHFKILDGYTKYFGIRPERVSYVPFKPNIRYRYDYKVGSDGDYVLCFGRSERDYDTFFTAMTKLPEVPVVIPPPNYAAFKKHSSRFTWDVNRLPANVRIVEDDGTAESLIRIIEKAKLVVLPIIGSRISPSGIGTYLNAMLMGKCVITTHGVATTDVLLNGEALLVPPEDPDALVDTIRRAWYDKNLRERTAEIGRLYSEACGGEPELRQRVLDRAIEKLVPAPERLLRSH